GLIDELAAPEHAVARQVGADVKIISQGRQPKVAGRGGRQQRARLRIEVAEAQKMAGEILRQDREISLHVAGRDAGGLAVEPAGASGEARGPTRLGDAFAGNGGNVHDASRMAGDDRSAPLFALGSCLPWASPDCGLAILSSPWRGKIGWIFAPGRVLLGSRTSKNPPARKGRFQNLGEPRWLTTTSDMIGVRSSGTAAR